MSSSIADLHCLLSIFERSGLQLRSSSQAIRLVAAEGMRGALQRGLFSLAVTHLGFTEGAVGVTGDPASTLFCSRLYSAVNLTSKAWFHNE